ncbi:hypothetical protein H4219_000389 [Mycoemilia scoparia]|uniref:Uncharacterized protein n=1 Tax=Mycoemilia scoparia TaxID=417184 RepID=A0A9W8DTA9_9FUNG|nr:hypothetical protein H4219_000389 [Mycoemilia scoparia]
MSLSADISSRQADSNYEIEAKVLKKSTDTKISALHNKKSRHGRSVLQQKNTNILSQQTLSSVKDKAHKDSSIKKLLEGTENTTFEDVRFISPDRKLDQLLERVEVETTHHSKQSSAHGDRNSTETQTGKNEAATPGAMLKKNAELENIIKDKDAQIQSLKSQLLDEESSKKDLKRKLEDKEQELREVKSKVEEMLETHVPRDDMDDIIAENQKLTRELRENEELLSECQKMLEEFVEKT